MIVVEKSQPRMSAKNVHLTGNHALSALDEAVAGEVGEHDADAHDKNAGGRYRAICPEGSGLIKPAEALVRANTWRATRLSEKAEQHEYPRPGSIYNDCKIHIGDRISVHWRAEDAWFSGTVVAYRAMPSTFDNLDDYRVIYDDGDDVYEPLGYPAPVGRLWKHVSDQAPPTTKAAVPHTSRAACKRHKVGMCTRAISFDLPSAEKNA